MNPKSRGLRAQTYSFVFLVSQERKKLLKLQDILKTLAAFCLHIGFLEKLTYTIINTSNTPISPFCYNFGQNKKKKLPKDKIYYHEKSLSRINATNENGHIVGLARLDFWHNLNSIFKLVILEKENMLYFIDLLVRKLT